MAQKINILIDQGATFVTSFTLNDENDVAFDLSTMSGTAQMRKHYTSNTYHSFSVATTNTGIVTLSMSANVTANIESGRYVYDVELVDSTNNVSRVVEGIVTVTPNVTR